MTSLEGTQQITELLKLAGRKEADASLTSLGYNMLLLKLISEARDRGVTWAQIGTVIVGEANGKLAKNAAKRLARITQRDLLRSNFNVSF